MKQALGDVLSQLSSILHWFGKYEESNAVAITERLVRTVNVTTLEEYEAWVERLSHPSEGSDA